MTRHSGYLRKTVCIGGLILSFIGIGTLWNVQRHPLYKGDDTKNDVELRVKNTRQQIGTIAHYNILHTTKIEPSMGDIEEQRNHERHNKLVQEIEKLLDERDQEIDALANEMYEREGCYEETGDSKGKKRPVDRQGLLDNISMYIGWFNESLNEKDFLDGRLFNNRNLELELADLKKDDPLQYNEVLTTAENLPSLLARARKNEKCLANDNNGIVDTYLDIERESEAGNCGQAINLSEGIGDKRKVLAETRYCVPSEYKQNLDAKQIVRANFYGTLPTLSDDNLAISAQVVGYEEQDRWYNSCRAIRTVRGIPREQSDAMCLADLVLGKMDSEGQFRVDLSADGVSRLAASIPRDQIRRICALEATRAQLQDDTGFGYGRETFDKCTDG